MLYDKILVELSLRLNKSELSFCFIREPPGIGRRPRTRDDIRLGRNLPIDFMLVRRKPDQTFKFRKLQQILSI